MGILISQKKEPYMEYHKGFWTLLIWALQVGSLLSPPTIRRWWSYGVYPFHVWCMLHLKTSPSGGPTCGGSPLGGPWNHRLSFFGWIFIRREFAGDPRRINLGPNRVHGIGVDKAWRLWCLVVWLFGVNWMWWKIPRNVSIFQSKHVHTT